MKKYLALILIGLVYVLFSQLITGDLFKSSYYPYHIPLLDAIFQGRLNVESSVTHDLSVFEGKSYPYWGIGSLIFILPFYILGLRGDILYTLVAGICNVVLFYFLIKEVASHFKIRLSQAKELFLTLSFAFLSPNFYLSLDGRIWHSDKILSVFFLLFFLFFFFKFLNSNFKNQKYLLVSLLFFCIAFLTRLPFIFYGLLFLYPLLLIRGDKKEIKSYISKVLLFTFAGFVIFGSYNFARFKNPLETGLSHHVPAGRYAEQVNTGKIFSLENLPHNFDSYFLKPITFSLEQQKINFDPEGNSIFSVYPFLFLVFLIFQRKYFRQKERRNFILIVFGVLVLELALILTFFATGWLQFGSRYIIDVIPLLLILTLFVIESVPFVFIMLILAYGLLVNFFGVMAYYQAFPV